VAAIPPTFLLQAKSACRYIYTVFFVLYRRDYVHHTKGRVCSESFCAALDQPVHKIYSNLMYRMEILVGAGGTSLNPVQVVNNLFFYFLLSLSELNFVKIFET
jgi:hypothetical protein